MIGYRELSLFAVITASHPECGQNNDATKTSRAWSLH
jgi:hypothetical protein